MSSSASRSRSWIPDMAYTFQDPDEAGSSQNIARPRPSTQARAIVRYICTVNRSCRRTFDNYNNWAQHETNFHRTIDTQPENDTKSEKNEAKINERMKPERQVGAPHAFNEIQEFNAKQKATAAQQADPLGSTYDIWYCDGVDGCMDGWHNLSDFEAHFREKHAMGWNKLPRSMLASDYLLGPRHGVRFWCGFCIQVLDVSSTEKWYYDRLSHVASHFDRTCLDEIWSGDIYGWYFIEMH